MTGDFLYLLLMAVFQGITEFVPVSSSGHLFLFQLLNNRRADTELGVFLHSGTLISSLLFFQHDLLQMTFQQFKTIVCACIPTAVIGLLLKKSFSKFSQNPLLISFFMLLTGLILSLTKFFQETKNNEEICASDSFLAGIVQGISVIPGISRSGATIAFLLKQGYSIRQAFRFSFLISIPAAAGALLLELLSSVGKKTVHNNSLSFYGVVVSAVCGCFSLSVFSRVISRKIISLCGFYLVLAGAVSFVLYLKKLSSSVKPVFSHSR